MEQKKAVIVVVVAAAAAASAASAATNIHFLPFLPICCPYAYVKFNFSVLHLP